MFFISQMFVVGVRMITNEPFCCIFFLLYPLFPIPPYGSTADFGATTPQTDPRSELQKPLQHSSLFPQISPNSAQTSSQTEPRVELQKPLQHSPGVRQACRFGTQSLSAAISCESGRSDLQPWLAMPAKRRMARARMTVAFMLKR